MSDVSTYKKISGGETHSKDNPIRKVVKDTTYAHTPSEIEFRYEIWQGTLEVPIRAIFSKHGLLIKGAPYMYGPDFFIEWKDVKEMTEIFAPKEQI